MKKIRHSKLPITLESSDTLTKDMLQAIEIQMTAYAWDSWIDEYGNWFRPFNENRNQLELFDKRTILVYSDVGHWEKNNPYEVEIDDR